MSHSSTPTLVLSLALLVSACGAPPTAPATPAGPAASAAETPVAAPSTPAAPPAPASAAPPAAPPTAAATTITKEQLQEANKIVMAAYPGPFAKTFEKVVAKIGQPKKKGENMFEWFAMDGGKCVQFFMTKDDKKGHAASGLGDSDIAACK